MSLFIAGLALFLGMHSISIANKPWRDAQVARLGEPVWKGLYSVVSLIGFGMLCYGYGETRANPVVLYWPPAAMKHVAMALLLPVFPLFLASKLAGRIKAAAKHPLLVATKLWALAHLLVNGNLADVILFGGFLAWAVADRIAVKRRPQEIVVVGEGSMRNDVLAVGLGLGIYVAFALWLHPKLIGVAIM